MRSIIRSFSAAVLLLAGCAAPHGLSASNTHMESGVFVVTVTAPPDWASGEPLSRGDDLATLVDRVRATHANGPLRVEVSVAGNVVATAESPKNGRVTFSMKK